jgi:thiol-disulfide isomerase/thioredoxin
MIRRTTLALGLLVAGATALVACNTATKSAQASCSTADECLPTVDYHDIHKQPFKKSNLDGKVVVVNFWATWCGPCKKEIPAFNRTYIEYKGKGVEFLGVLYDNQVDDTGLLNFMSDHEMTYPVIRADRPVLEAYAYPKALPTTFIYDRKGKLLEMHRGPMSEASLRAQLDEALSR